MPHRAVLFDVGGVVVGSPLEAIARFERERDIPAGFVNRVVVASADGAWSRLERGELTLEAFYPVFEAECTAAGCTLSALEMMAAVAGATVPRPAMLEAIRRIRARGFLAAAVTNNWIHAEDDGTRALRSHFDAFVESSVVGFRKPDPRIFELACTTLGIAAREAILLDDIGANLKSARALGMTTIKVADPDVALAELETVLGFSLR